MSVETLPDEFDKLVDLSQEALIPISQESVDNFKDVIKQSKENTFNEVGNAESFFQDHENDSELVFEACCTDELVQKIRHAGMGFLKAKKSVEGQKALDLDGLIGEVIKDAVSHTPDKEKYKFIVKIIIDPKNPANYSFLVINPSSVLSKDFSEQKKDTGLGNIMKKGFAADLGGEIRNIDIMAGGKKIYHGFEFKKGEF